MDKISIIIPAYNVEPYIKKCLNSVLSQSYRDLEVLVVNDGSTDNTDDVIKTYLSDDRVKYITQNNAGVSAARNAGINEASGDYLAFVDSDDFLERGTYEKLYAAITKEHADVAVCDYNLIYEDRVERHYSGMRDEAVDIDMPDYFYKYVACPKPNNYIWTRLYKTGVIKKSGVRFVEFKLGDEVLFNFKLLPYIKRVANISDSLYNYLQRRDSNIYTVAKRCNLASVYADTFDALVGHYKSNGFENFLEAMPIHAYTRLRSVFFYSRLAGMDDDEIISNIENGFGGRVILKYLSDVSGVDKYIAANGLTSDDGERIRQIMRTAAGDLKKLNGSDI